MAAALGVEFPHREQEIDWLPVQNGSIVIKAAMKEGDLAVVATCPVVYRKLDYGCSLRAPLTLRCGCPGTPSSTLCPRAGIKNSRPVLLQDVLGIGGEVQGCQQPGQN